MIHSFRWFLEAPRVEKFSGCLVEAMKDDYSWLLPAPSGSAANLDDISFDDAMEPAALAT
jgi:hypothetical protein